MRALVLSAVAAVCAAAAAAVLVTPDEHVFSPGRPPLLGVALGLAFAAAGLLAARRRPRNRTGILLVATGVAWLLPALSGAEQPVVFTLGVLLGSLVFAFVTWLILAFPTGLLELPVHRAIVVVAFVLTTLGYGLYLAFASGATLCSSPCPDNALLVADRPDLADGLFLVLEGAGAGLALATLAIMVRRWLRSTAAERSVLAPVYATGGAGVAAVGATVALEAVDHGVYEAARWVTAAVLLTIPLGFLLGVLRTKLARAAVSRLLLDVPDEPTIEQAQSGVRTVIGDPTAELWVWDASTAAYLDASGATRDAPADGTRGVTPIGGYGDRPIALLVHDPTLLQEPELLEEVAATIRVGLEKDRTLRVLRASERRSRALLRALPDVMYRIRRDGTYIDFHANDPRDLAAPPDRIVGANLRDVLPADIAERAMRGIEAAVDSGEVQLLEYKLKRPFRGLRDAETRIVRSGDDEVVVTVRDVTARKRQEELLERERDFQRRAINASPSLFAVVDTDGGTIFFNTALERLSGHANDETIDPPNPFWELFLAPEDRDDARAAVSQANATGDTVRRESTWQGLAGERRTVSWTLTPILNEEGKTRLLVTGLDITPRKLQEEQLQRERDFLDVLANTTPSMLAILDERGRVVDGSANEAFERTLGYRAGEVGALSFWNDVVPPEEAGEVRYRVETASEGPSPVGFENTWLAKDGRRLSVAWACTRLADPGGPSYLITGLDVTEREQSERRTRALLEAIPDAMYRIRRDGTYLDFHSADPRDLPAPPDRIVGRKLQDVAPPHLVERLMSSIDRTLETGEVQTVEYDVERPEKGMRNVEARVVRSGDDEIVGIVRDVTDRRRQEEEIRASRARIVEAADGARKRLERNLHDGAQQRLVSLSISLRLAVSRLRDDPAAAEGLLTTATDELALAIEELRELARGIHPAILTDRGLVPALKGLASRSPVPVDLEMPEERLPEPVEAAAYYVVSESLANVAKYAEASRVRVCVERANGLVTVEVEDDGVGGADTSRGTGLLGLADRVAALGGQLDVTSPPGAGTTVRAAMPAEPSAAR